MNKLFNDTVSIITVVKNGDKTIQRCINSVINQDYKNIEYIIVDGKSNDLTKEIILKNNKHISKWISESDSGTSNAVNKGLKMANGSYILLLSCDDYLPKNFVSTAMEHAKNGSDLVFGDLVYLDQKDNLVFRQMGDRNYWNCIKYRMPRLNSPSCVIKANVYKEIGHLNEKYKFANDYELLFRIYLAGFKISYCNDLFIYHYLGGLSSTNYLKSQFEVCIIAIKLGKTFIRAPVYFLWVIFRRFIRNLLIKIAPGKFSNIVLNFVRKNYMNHR